MLACKTQLCPSLQLFLCLTSLVTLSTGLLSVSPTCKFVPAWGLCTHHCLYLKRVPQDVCLPPSVIQSSAPGLLCQRLSLTSLPNAFSLVIFHHITLFGSALKINFSICLRVPSVLSLEYKLHENLDSPNSLFNHGVSPIFNLEPCLANSRCSITAADILTSSLPSPRLCVSSYSAVPAVVIFISQRYF